MTASDGLPAGDARAVATVEIPRILNKPVPAVQFTVSGLVLACT